MIMTLRSIAILRGALASRVFHLMNARALYRDACAMHWPAAPEEIRFVRFGDAGWKAFEGPFNAAFGVT
jgi:hypothetical protein